ncbi:MAG: hypothetical protein HWN67_14110 [Candidatus Helarchaeota archaeon]|nr:hypothetical protein [Candidatus Helarchaeota archaeon]
MFKKSINFCIFFVFLFFTVIIFANVNPQKGVFLKGEIESKVDFFGRRFFEGKIINNLDRRVDFVFIEFKIINNKNELIEKIRSYVYGTVHIFKDNTVSTSSIEPGKIANFKCFTSVTPDSVKKFDYNIGWKVFDELPEKY